ncbi:MAG: FKBP-type peptidyl-prolyl cis-trans isomerase [Bacteroidia bacterium]|nr:FKBP-type peptidyl-prolyl cis-trans isomerase [Bacteroidia bacterium]
MKFKNLFFVTLGILVIFSCVRKDQKAVSLKSEVDSLSYSMGISTGMYFKQSGIDTVNSELFNQAVIQVIKKDSNYLIKPDQANQFLQMYFMKLQKKKFEKNITAGQKFLEENKKKPGIVTTQSGLQYIAVKEGKGENPKPTDIVSVHYKGTLINGTVFDSSEGKDPVSFPVNRVIPGWTEALQLMKPGAKFQLFIPYNIAYGDRGAGQQIEPYSTLIFDVELLKIEKPEDQKKQTPKKK